MIGKKGQITVFIIIGLLLLAGIVTYISIRQIRGEGRADIPRIEEVPLEFQPIRSYVENCLKIKAEGGLKLVMDHGGYIDPKVSGITANSAEPTSSNGVAFEGGFIVPYWYYLKSDNKCTQDCEFSSERPTLESIELQLGSYIKESIRDCTLDFEAFKEEGYDVIENGDINVKTTVLDNDVLFVMEYPLIVTKDDATKDIRNFYTRIGVKLKDMYVLATLIANLETQYRFLERDAIQLIVGFSGLDEEKLPPMSDSRFGFGNEVVWTKNKVKRDVEEMLMQYMWLLRAQNTLNFEELSFGDTLKDALYNIHMIIPLGEDYNHLAASFSYLNMWPVYFDLNCDGELCKPLSVSQNFLVLIGFQRYEFAYDLSFPAMVEIYDPSAFNNKGYYFRYFLEANLRNNEVLWHDFLPLRSVDFASGSMLCDVDKRNSGEIEVNVKDSEGKAIDNVDVFYSCGEESCAIGTASRGRLKEKFPVCVGGFISVVKEGHLTTSKLFSTILDEKDEMDIVLEPLLEKKFEIKKKRVVRVDDYWQFSNNEVSIDREEEALITLTRVGALGDQEHVIAAEYSRPENIFEEEENTITIAPGIYDISIQLYDNKEFVIPEETRETGGSFLGFGEEEYTIPEVRFDDSWPSGGLELQYEFKEEDLRNNDKIVFFVVSPALTVIPESERHAEDLGQLGKFKEYSTAYAISLWPRFE